MPFPVTPRVIYQDNPLIEVVCQLRFPPILKIDHELPALFQEAIRSNYPNFVEVSGISTQTEPMVNPGNPNDIFEQLTKQNFISFKEYRFSSSDEIWKVTLSRTFIALSTSKYERWEEFRSKLEFLFNKFIEIYNPSYFSRIGLRYIDLVDREKLNIKEVSWNDLLQDYVLGLISTPEGKTIKAFECKYELGLADEESIVAIRTSFAKANESKNLYESFVIDSDFFNNNKTTSIEVFNKLDFFHDRATRLIRWAIKPKLHDALKPIELK